MHWQSSSPSRERNHRISLLPMERPAGEPPLWLALPLLILLVIVVAIGSAVFSS